MQAYLRDALPFGYRGGVAVGCVTGTDVKTNVGSGCAVSTGVGGRVGRSVGVAVAGTGVEVAVGSSGPSVGRGGGSSVHVGVGLGGDIVGVAVGVAGTTVGVTVAVGGTTVGVRVAVGEGDPSTVGTDVVGDGTGVGAAGVGDGDGDGLRGTGVDVATTFVAVGSRVCSGRDVTATVAVGASCAERVPPENGVGDSAGGRLGDNVGIGPVGARSVVPPTRATSVIDGATPVRSSQFVPRIVPTSRSAPKANVRLAANSASRQVGRENMPPTCPQKGLSGSSIFSRSCCMAAAWSRNRLRFLTFASDNGGGAVRNTWRADAVSTRNRTCSAMSGVYASRHCSRGLPASS